jgi:ABC-type transport system involved in multi-copper enzyme maturation permease subunit
MIFQIAKKDFLNNLLSARFIIGFILCLVLIPFSIMISIDDYRDQARLYRLNRDSADQDIKSVRVYSALRPEVVKPPEPLSVFSKGISGNIGNRVKIYLGEKPMLAAGKPAARDNPYLNAFFSIDFAGITAIIFALLALIFSYDVFTREKEDGTLRLQMSNSLSRSRFFAGKVLGIFLILLPILLFCYLLGAVIILLSRDPSFTAVEWGRIALLFAASLLYLAVFIFIGLLVSTRCKTSVTSLIICLFLWVFFVFVIPNLSVYFAESFARVQSRDNLTRVIEDLNKELRRKIDDHFKTLPKPDWEMYWYNSGGADGFKEIYGSSKSLFERERLSSAYAEPLRIDYADKKWASQAAYLESLARQQSVADRISLISPAGILRIVASAICLSDAHSQDRFMDLTRQYRETFIRYLESKNIFSSFRYITPTPPRSFMTGDEIIEKRTGGEFKTQKALDEWAGRQKDRMSSFEKLRKIEIPGTRPDDYPYLDISDMPQFQEQPKLLFTGLESTIVNIGLILIECVILFYVGFVVFIRYDVR